MHHGATYIHTKNKAGDETTPRVGETSVSHSWPQPHRGGGLSPPTGHWHPNSAGGREGMHARGLGKGGQGAQHTLTHKLSLLGEQEGSSILSASTHPSLTPRLLPGGAHAYANVVRHSGMSSEPEWWGWPTGAGGREVGARRHSRQEGWGQGWGISRGHRPLMGRGREGRHGVSCCSSYSAIYPASPYLPRHRTPTLSVLSLTTDPGGKGLPPHSPQVLLLGDPAGPPAPSA